MESVENERLQVHEGDIKVCRDAVLHYFWCSFAEIYNLISTWYCAFIRLNSFKSFQNIVLTKTMGVPLDI